jgi:hypothetical protein
MAIGFGAVTGLKELLTSRKSSAEGWRRRRVTPSGANECTHCYSLAVGNRNTVFYGKRFGLRVGLRVFAKLQGFPGKEGTSSSHLYMRVQAELQDTLESNSKGRVPLLFKVSDPLSTHCYGLAVGKGNAVFDGKSVRLGVGCGAGSVLRHGVVGGARTTQS